MGRKFLINFSLVVLGFTFLTCQDRSEIEVNKAPLTKEHQQAASYTIHENELTALIDNSLSSYFIYKGEPKGFEYELLRLFAKHAGLELKLKIIKNNDYILDSLIHGGGDLVAANLTISNARLKRVNFTTPLFTTRQILVQRLPEDYKKLTADDIDQLLIREPIELEGKTITVRKNSSYYERLKNFAEETSTRFHLQLAPDNYVTDILVEKVSKGEVDYTVCDENIARLICPSFNNLDCKTSISFSQKIGWAVRKENQQLLDSLNTWIDQAKGSKEFNVIYDKYFKVHSKTRKTVRTDYEFISGKNISEYDNLIKKHASQMNWDWKLLAAQIYQESNFNASNKSWAGAIGLMQVMPGTAHEYGVKSNKLFNPEDNLTVGVAHLNWLKHQWDDIIQDSTEVIKFTLASYNAGLGHVSDARRMAKKNGMNPNQWDDSVAQMMLLKMKPKYYTRPEVKYGYCRGAEPVNYVKNIFQLYDLYKAIED